MSLETAPSPNAEPDDDAPPEPVTPRGAVVLRVLLGILAGLAIAEGAARARDNSAFPHLNVYVADPVLGVRLRPGESERISFGGNPPTDVFINSLGFRGDEWGPPLPDELVVIGDSQVFGLGVPIFQTFVAHLSVAMPDVGTRNAGVPTYGPLEYEKVAAELLSSRQAKRLVVVYNLANDLSETERPNVERLAVSDGWAVPRETAPASSWRFPGRDTLFRKSHAVFALRRLLHAEKESAEAPGLPPSGAWKDIAIVAARVTEARADSLAKEPAAHPRGWSPLASSVARLATLCASSGARLFVVALPLDVQVSETEWAKYGRTPTDMTPARVLVEDLLAAAEDQGVSAVDLTKSLAAAEPGAFLDRDLHLSAKGHEAAAKAIATMIASEPPRH